MKFITHEQIIREVKFPNGIVIVVGGEMFGFEVVSLIDHQNCTEVITREEAVWDSYYFNVNGNIIPSPGELVDNSDPEMAKFHEAIENSLKVE